MNVKFIVILFTLSSTFLASSLFADREDNISIRVEAFDFYGTNNNNLCFVFTGFNTEGRIENASVRPCHATTRVSYAFVGDRAVRNFRFVTDKFGHTWISEIHLTSEFMQDFFNTAEYFSVLRRKNLSIKTSLVKTSFPVIGLGETHTLSYAEPFKVDIDWSADIRNRPVTYRITDYQASFALKIKQIQIFEADEEGIPRSVVRF